MRQPKRKETKAQLEAARKNIATARKDQAIARAAAKAHHRKLKRSKAQKQATLKAVAASAAARHRKAQGLKPLPKHPRALAGPAGLMPTFGNDIADVCSAAAVAAHLYLRTGIIAPDAEVAAIWRAAGGVITDVLECVSDRGLADVRLAAYWPVASQDALPGTVAGLRLPQGRHAVVALTDGACLSWGSIVRLDGLCEEDWWLEWEMPGE